MTNGRRSSPRLSDGVAGARPRNSSWCRRRWSLEPGASVSAVAREAGIHPGQLYGWRRQLGVRPQIGFTRVSHAALCHARSIECTA
jgi:transposase-like protein